VLLRVLGGERNPSLRIDVVAAWLASVGVFDIAVASKPCCYGFWAVNAIRRCASTS